MDKTYRSDPGRMMLLSDLEQQLSEAANRAQKQLAIDRFVWNAGGSLRAAWLRGRDLSHLDLGKVNLFDVGLQEALFCDTIFGILSRCVLDEGVFTGAYVPRMVRSSCRGADYARARIGGWMHRCDFTRASFRRARIMFLPRQVARRLAPSTFDEADFTEADAVGKYFRGSSLVKARFRRARIARADFSGCDLTHADFRGARLWGVRFDGAKLKGARFAGAVVSPELAAALRQRKTLDTTKLRILPCEIGPMTASLIELLKPLESYRIKWRFGAFGIWPREKVILVKQPGGKPHGIAFEYPNAECLRTYGLAERSSLQRIFADLAADYAEWGLRPRTVEVDTKPAHCARDVRGALLAALRELYP